MKQINLAEKAVLANLSFSRWGGYAYDRKATDEVHQSNNAAADAGNYNKRLLPKGATSKIDSVVNAAREYHKSHTSPWLDDGRRILPSTFYMEYAKRMKEFKQEFEDACADFFKEYPGYVKTAQKRLGKMFREDEFPAIAEIKAHYSFSLDILPFPDSADFRVELDGIDEIKREMQARMKEVYEGAMRDVAERITTLVGRMSERLKGYKPGKPGKRAEGTFKDSLVDNIKELADVLPHLNMAGDPKLAKIIERINKELCQTDAETLREDDKLRKKVATSADQVLTAIADFIA